MGNSFPALIFSVGGQEMVELVMAVRERKRRSLIIVLSVEIPDKTLIQNNDS